jgi:hypothetical protein
LNRQRKDFDMNLQEAQQKLYDQTFVLGRMRRKAAFKYLAETTETEAMDVLADALKKYKNPKEVESVLVKVEDSAKIDRLWQLWSDGRSTLLGDVLKKIQKSSSDERLSLLSLLKIELESRLPLDLKNLRSAMGFVTDTDEDVVKAVVRFAERFPISEEFNDELFAAWIKTTSKYLQHVIQTQNRRPRSPSTEALFFLATGQTQRYQAMKDNDGGLFLEAWIMAPDALRRIINDTVAGSGDWRLAEAYEKALISREDFNIEVHVKALKTAKNDEKLFEAARYMRLPELLDLCEYWTSNQWQPADARVQKVVTVAVKAYRKMRAIPIKSADPLPSGAVDIFDFWKSQNPDDRELKAGFQSEDPFIRAKSLHIGHSKGLVSETDMARAEQSDHWPDRLWARMQFHLVGKAGPDHVEWIDTCTGIDGIMASARVACTPDEYESFKHQFERMVQSKASAADRSLYLLGILQAFQRYFNSGWIEVKEDDSAAESGAIEVMDAADLSF